MKWRSLSAFALLAAARALAQAPSDETPPAMTDPALIQQSNGIKYLNGGASEDDRARLQAQAAEYPVRIELSGKGGEYLVADSLVLSNSAGRPIASVPNAGPIVMFNLPPGRYTAEVSLPDGEHGRRTISVGRDLQTLSWNFPEAPK
jgi:hypothetical protein